MPRNSCLKLTRVQPEPNLLPEEAQAVAERAQEVRQKVTQGVDEPRSYHKATVRPEEVHAVHREPGIDRGWAGKQYYMPTLWHTGRHGRGGKCTNSCRHRTEQICCRTTCNTDMEPTERGKSCLQSLRAGVLYSAGPAWTFVKLQPLTTIRRLPRTLKVARVISLRMCADTVSCVAQRHAGRSPRKWQRPP